MNDRYIIIFKKAKCLVAPQNKCFCKKNSIVRLRQHRGIYIFFKKIDFVMQTKKYRNMKKKNCLNVKKQT